MLMSFREDISLTAYTNGGLSAAVRDRMVGGASRDRTDDLIIANDALSQLSYGPKERCC